MKLDLPQPEVEARVLAAVLTNDRMLDLAGDLEVRDFADLRNRKAFEAVRELQATGDLVSVFSVADEIALRDMERETHVADSAGLYYLAELVIHADEQLNDEAFLADLRQLRRIATERGL